MKKKIIKPVNEYKENLKIDLCNNITNFEDIAEELDLTPEQLTIFNNAARALKVDMYATIDDTEQSCDYIIKDRSLMDDIFQAVNDGEYDISKENQKIVLDYIEANGPYKVIHCPSLAESMKVDNFIAELKENPYVLPL